jgi:T5SS/PEP-CTERM-associated repeat protein
VDVFGGSFIATNATARIGDDGNGTLSQFGGLVVLDGASVGRGSNAVGRVNVRGGLMQPGSLSLGRFATAQGTLEVSGGSLDMSTSTLYVGREGAGTAIFSNGIALAQTVIIAASNTASGALQLRGGSLTAGQLLATRPSAQLQFDSGTLVVTQSTTVANGAAFVVGNGSQIATLQLDGGNHSFANGLTLSSNAVLKGSGTVTGTITVLPGGSNQLGVPAGLTLAPGFIGGKFTFSFPSATGKFYDVFARTNLATTNWTLQTTLSGTGAVLTYTNNPTNPAQLFRVQIR